LPNIIPREEVIDCAIDESALRPTLQVFVDLSLQTPDVLIGVMLPVKDFLQLFRISRSEMAVLA
jgi:hypothetical protein